ncbi:hypothetical protein ACWD3I_46235 [Streptomyces sp. NPDC002817]|uniref:hypothetical protein n=1 Tax=Streptomyces sp. NPDC088357 TaxID=3154655 RepID=UPI0034126BA4
MCGVVEVERGSRRTHFPVAGVILFRVISSTRSQETVAAWWTRERARGAVRKAVTCRVRAKGWLASTVRPD